MLQMTIHFIQADYSERSRFMKKRSYSQSSVKNKTDQGKFVNANTLELRWLDEKTAQPIKKDKKPIRPTNHARETVFIHNIAVDEDMETYELSKLMEPNYHEIPSNLMEQSNIMVPKIEIVEVPPALLAPEVTLAKKDSILERKNELKNMAIIYTDDIVNEGITREKIANYAVDSTKIKPESINSGTLADYAVSTNKLANESVTSIKISKFSVEEQHLTNGSITGAKLRDRSIYGEKIADNSISSEKLMDKTIDSIKIADGSILSKIKPSSQRK
jgi:hypothetical protein